MLTRVVRTAWPVNVSQATALVSNLNQVVQGLIPGATAPCQTSLAGTEAPVWRVEQDGVNLALLLHVWLEVPVHQTPRNAAGQLLCLQLTWVLPPYLLPACLL